MLNGTLNKYIALQAGIFAVGIVLKKYRLRTKTIIDIIKEQLKAVLFYAN